MWVLEPPPSDRSIEMADLSPLRRRMIEDMTVRNLSPATQRSYISAVSKFSRYFGRSPDRLELDVRAFQVHLVSTGISWSALNQIVCALRFFLRRHARRGAHAGAHSLCARTAQAAGRAQRRRSASESRVSRDDALSVARVNSRTRCCRMSSGGLV